MSDSYDLLRADLAGSTKAMDAIFIGLATQYDGMTTAIVTMAALDVPIDRVAKLLLRTPSEIDALTTLFKESMRRDIARERAARKGGTDAA